MSVPSYNKMLDAAIKVQSKNHPVWRYNSKIAGREMAASLGIRVPELISGPGALHELDFSGTDFVLKPVNGAASRGVFPLRRIGPDRFYDLIRGVEWDVESLFAAAVDSRKSMAGHPDELQQDWFIEEMIARGDELAYDWKFFTFGGKAALVWQCDHTLGNRGSRYVRWWTPEWGDANDPAPSLVRPINLEMPTPVNGSALLSAVSKIADMVESPHVRVDMYESADGHPVFGEITPHHGGGTLPFLPEWDRILGEAWLEAIR